jgi:glutathione S-transferase
VKSKVAILYMDNDCPFSMRAKLAFFSSKIQCEFHAVEDHKKDYCPHHHLDENHTHMCVELSNGTRLENSVDIMKFALNISDPDHWLDCDNVDCWLSHMDKLFMNGYKVYLHPEAYPDISWKKEMEAFLICIESALFENKGYLDALGRWSFKDALVAPMVYKISVIDEDWWNHLPFPKIHIWLNQFKSSAVFQRVNTSEKGAFSMHS